MTLDIYRGDTLTGARSWADLLLDERRRRAIVAAQHLDAGSLWALTEAHTLLYGRAGASLSPRTARAYREGVAKFLQYAERTGLSVIRPSRDAGPLYARALEAAGLAPSSVRVQLAAARALYRALRWAGVTQLDPFSDTKVAKDKTAAWDKRQPYTQAEVSALVEAAGPRDRALILLCAHGGLRIAEALALTWDDVQGDAMTVQHGKGGKLRRVALSGSLRGALNSLEGQGREGLVVGATQTAARERLRLMCKRTGMPYRGWHAFRHYAGTRLVEQMGSLEEAARHLGHVSIETTRVYAKWNDQALSKALAKW